MAKHQLAALPTGDSMMLTATSDSTSPSGTTALVP